MGYVAGMTLDEMCRSQPGFVMDMYVMRVKYDTQLSGMRIAGLFGGGKR